MENPTAKRTRRTIDDRIAELQAKIKVLEEKKKANEMKKIKAQKVKLTRDTEGMSDLLAWVDQIAAQNNVRAADVVMAVAKLKRTGLKFAAK